MWVKIICLNTLIKLLHIILFKLLVLQIDILRLKHIYFHAKKFRLIFIYLLHESYLHLSKA